MGTDKVLRVRSYKIYVGLVILFTILSVVSMYFVDMPADTDISAIKLPFIDQKRLLQHIEGDPTILNYDKYCRNPSSHHIITKLRVDGLFQSGTDFAYKLISQNCNDTTQTQLWMQMNSKMNSLNPYHQKLEEQSLHIIIIRDPLTWIKSFCINHYNFIPLHLAWFYNLKCPENINRSAVRFIKEPIIDETYESLAHVYNEWYSNIQTHNASFKYIIVKYEDILIFTQKTIKMICHCQEQHKMRITENVNVNKTYRYTTKKDIVAIIEQERTKLSFTDYRYVKYSKEDLLYIASHIDTSLLDKFGYRIDALHEISETAKRLNPNNWPDYRVKFLDPLRALNTGKK